MVAVRELVWSVVEVASAVSAIAGLHALAGTAWTLLIAGIAGTALTFARAAGQRRPAPSLPTDGDNW